MNQFIRFKSDLGITATVNARNICLVKKATGKCIVFESPTEENKNHWVISEKTYDMIQKYLKQFCDILIVD